MSDTYRRHQSYDSIIHLLSLCLARHAQVDNGETGLSPDLNEALAKRIIVGWKEAVAQQLCHRSHTRCRTTGTVADIIVTNSFHGRGFFPTITHIQILMSISR
jgi:hypothetical protein